MLLIILRKCKITRRQISASRKDGRRPNDAVEHESEEAFPENCANCIRKRDFKLPAVLITCECPESLFLCRRDSPPAPFLLFCLFHGTVCS